MREWKLPCDAWSRVKIDTRWRCWTSWSRLEDGWELAEKNILRIVILWLLKLWDYSKASIWLIIPRSISSDIGPSWMSRSWKLFPFEPRMIVNEEAFLGTRIQPWMNSDLEWLTRVVLVTAFNCPWSYFSDTPPYDEGSHWSNSTWNAVFLSSWSNGNWQWQIEFHKLFIR